MSFFLDVFLFPEKVVSPYIYGTLIIIGIHRKAVTYKRKTIDEKIKERWKTAADVHISRKNTYT